MTALLQEGRVIERTYGGHASVLFACTCCGYLRFDPLPPEAVLDVYYAKTYWSAEQARQDIAFSYPPVTEFENTAKHLIATFGAHGRDEPMSAHELGCGLGATVHHLNRLGGHATGSDLSVEAVAAAQAAGNHAVMVAPLGEALAIRGAQPNLFYLGCVIEHFIDPAAVLDDLRTTLPDGGLVVARTLNALHFASRAHDFTAFTWFQYPAHLHYFAPKSLATLFATAGYRVITLRAIVREDHPDITFRRSFGRAYTQLPNAAALLTALAENFLTMEIEIVARKPRAGELPGLSDDLAALLDTLEA